MIIIKKIFINKLAKSKTNTQLIDSEISDLYFCKKLVSNYQLKDIFDKNNYKNFILRVYL